MTWQNGASARLDSGIDVDYHENHLFDDLDLFNQKLADWLVDYNAIRPHKGLGLKTPVQAVIENNKKCNMWWTHTFI